MFPITLKSLTAFITTVAITHGVQANEFSRPAVDLGIVVSDLEKSTKFYTAAIGLKPTGGFVVPGEFAGKAGLSDRKTLNIKTFTLGEGPAASTIKLMAFEGTKSDKPKNKHIHSSLGFSYLTIHVKDTAAAMARLAKVGVKPHENSPIALPATNVYITLVRDPDGNFVELVGPKSDAKE